MSNKFQSPEYKNLKSKKFRLFSFSELSTYEECPKKYNYQYIQKIKTVNNVYSYLGTLVHDHIEQFYDSEFESNTEMVNHYLKEYDTSPFLFRGETAGCEGKECINYRKATSDYLNNLKPLTIKFEQEKLVYLPITLLTEDPFFTNFAFHGYVDLIMYHKNGSISIIDYKTSTWYTGEDKKKKSYQLILYALALEKVYGFKINKIAWDFVKYANVKYSVGKSERSKRMKRNDLENMKMQHINSINHAIEFIDYTEESKKEAIDWVINTLKKCENLKYSNLKVNEISCKNYDIDFFCQNLCPFYSKCTMEKNT